MSNWLDKLTGDAVSEKAPKGFYTLRQISKLKGYSTRRIADFLKTEIDAGRVKMVKVRIKSGQREYPVPHYGPAK